MNHIIIIATSNPLKSELYTTAFCQAQSSSFKAVMGLEDVINFNSWVRGVRGHSIEELVEIPEPHPSAAQNALEKLQGYLSQMYSAYESRGGKIPGLTLAIDDDFQITAPVPNNRQPKGAIKRVGNERVFDKLLVAQYHSDTVDLYGKETDLRGLALSQNQMALPIVFDYSLAAGILRPELIDIKLPGSWLFVEVYTSTLQVPGFLLSLKNSPDNWFFEQSPVVWIPDIPGINGSTMGMLVKNYYESRSSEGLNPVLGINFNRAQQLAVRSFEGWERVGEYFPKTRRLKTSSNY